MNYKMLFFLITTFGITVANLDRSMAGLLDREVARSQFTTANCFEDCQDLSPKSAQAQLKLKPDKTAISFKAIRVAGYDSLDYTLTYTHEPGVMELITGTLNNSGHTATINSGWLILGTCSSGSCTYHAGIENISLILNLKINGQVVETLTQTLAN